MELLKTMNEYMFKTLKYLTKTKNIHINLWKNFSIETTVPDLFRKYQVTMYNKITNVLDGVEKKL